MKAEILYKGSVVGTITNNQTILLHCADKVLTGNVVVRAIKDVTPTLITFTIDGITYQAEEGMTWGQWIDSDYNGGLFLIGEYVVAGSGFNIMHADGGLVTSKHLIIDGYGYKIYTGANN